MSLQNPTFFFTTGHLKALDVHSEALPGDAFCNIPREFFPQWASPSSSVLWAILANSWARLSKVGHIAIPGDFVNMQSLEILHVQSSW